MYKLTDEEITDSIAKRNAKKQEFIKEYKKPLVCLTLNVPGNIKVFDLANEAFDEGIRRIDEAEKGRVVFKSIAPHRTGYEAFFIIDDDAIALKKRMIQIENDPDLGIIFDMDVYDENGNKITREELNYQPRKCMICDHDYKDCLRKGTHSNESLYIELSNRIHNYFYNK